MFRQYWLALPRLIRFMLANFADGVALGWACGLVVTWFDLAGVGGLLASHDPALTLLFFAYSGGLFGTLAMSVAVMNLREED